MPGGGDSVGGGLQEKDDGRGPFVLGEAAGSGLEQGVRGVDVDQVAGGTHSDAEWEGSGGETVLGSHGPWQRTAEIQDGLTDRRVTAEVSC